MSSPRLDFERHEKKYLLDAEQYGRMRSALESYTQPEEYPRSTILSLYYDTVDYSLIRASLEQPVYKEKLRLRSYGIPGPDDMVFVELKKKFDGVVYKRRTALPLHLARSYLAGAYQPQDSQIVRELDFFMKRHILEPAAMLAYDREALAARDNAAVRITFDQNIRGRAVQPDLAKGDWGTPVLPPETVLMELKTPGAVPLWLAQLLSELKIYPAHFSKYGAFYQEYLVPDAKLISIRKDVFHCA